VSFHGELRPYQAEAVTRCVERGRMLIALVPGAGKTPLTIAIIEQLNADFDDTLSGLVFASSALRYQWADEIAKFTGGQVDKDGNWTGGASVLVIDGDLTARKKLYRRAEKEQPQYILLGYEQAVSDYALVRALPRDFMIMDEISCCKSPASQRSQAIKSLDSPFKYGLTGTPMENGKPDELFSIMECIDPSVLGDARVFERTFVTRNAHGWIVGYKNLPLLHKTLKEAMIRISRDNPAVAAYMPKQHPPRVHHSKLDADSADVYRVMSIDLQEELAMAVQARSSFDVFALYSGAGNQGDAVQGRISSKITAMRMLLTHPAILRKSAEQYASPASRSGSAYAHELLKDGVLDDLPNNGAKFDDVVDRIDDVLNEDDGNKVVVFSFFKGALAELSGSYGDESVQFHGGMNAKAKAAAKRRFQYDPSVRLFLSSDAGGYGVDLPQANYLINVDLPYSKGKSEQRNSRHDRTSSLHEIIHTETFLVAGSLEEFYAEKLRGKGNVARAIVDGIGHDRKGRMELGAHTLLEFLQNNDV
jgi:SNF2 family DNA or RNA helicase